MFRSFVSPLIVLFFSFNLGAQTAIPFEINHESRQVELSAQIPLTYRLKLVKDETYQIALMQFGLDVMLVLKNQDGKTLVEHDSPNGMNGKEIFEYSPDQSGVFHLTIQRFEQETNAASGRFSLYVKKITPEEKEMRKRTALALAVENKKNILTLDIDHFWEAYDRLKECKNHFDSVSTIQTWYLDRGTDGLKDFIERRSWSADEFVDVLGKNGAYFDSVRVNTYVVKQSEPLLEEVFAGMKNLYANFHPFKVCFAIGFLRTGGTTSDRFVLIGTEMTTVGDAAKIPLRIKGIVTHECVHTQQKSTLDSNAVVCMQLYSALREGAANYIGELNTGTTNYSDVDRYGLEHEQALWQEFKSTLCRQDADIWLYNGDRSPDRPADLGYFIGYQICKAYYHQASDKRQAIIDIIEMDDPLDFLIKSGYDQLPKK